MLNNKKQKLFDFAASIGIENIGICDANFDKKLFNILKKREEEGGKSEFENDDLLLRCSPNLVLDGAKSVIVCLFPYYNKDFSFKNISRYSSIKDYHTVALSKLNEIACYIDEKIEHCEFMCFSDTGPLVDRYLAYKAGLGFYGKNNCLINDRLGSYFFIGHIITSCEFAFDSPLDKSCLGCDKCIKACPGGALGKNQKLDVSKCVSYITQIKEITKAQQEILNRQESVYGCDICQEVCPHNSGLLSTILSEFSENNLDFLSYNEIATISNRMFRRKYKNFAFSWRGREIILKNFSGGKYVKQ